MPAKPARAIATAAILGSRRSSKSSARWNAAAARSRRFRSASRRLAVAARGRRLDDDCFAGIDHGGIAAFKLFDRTVLAPHAVLADLAVAAAGEPERRHPAMAGQNRAFHFFQETDGAADAVAGIPLAAAAGVFPDMEILEQHRITEFQNFRIGQ